MEKKGRASYTKDDETKRNTVREEAIPVSISE